MRFWCGLAVLNRPKNVENAKALKFESDFCSLLRKKQRMLILREEKVRST